MIITALFDLIFGIVNLLLSPFKLLDIAINTNIFTTIMEYLNVVFYVLPIDNFIPIIVFVVATMGMRILISIIKTVWQLLPIV